MEQKPLLDLLELAQQQERLLRERALLRERTGLALRTARDAANLSQSDLAAAAGVSQPYLSQIERGERTASPEQIRSLDKALSGRGPTSPKGGSNGNQDQKRRRKPAKEEDARR